MFYQRWLKLKIRRYSYYFLLGLLTLYLTVLAVPAFSQTELVDKPEDWFQRGQTAYEVQDYPQAVSFLEQAIDGFKEQQQALKQAVALGNLSLAYQALGQWTQAEAIVDNSLSVLRINRRQLDESNIPDLPDPYLQVLAPILDIDGQLWLSQAQFEFALRSWRQSEKIYHYLQNDEGVIGSQTYQLQALQSLGLYLQADELASSLEKQLPQIEDPLLSNKALRSLGDTYRAVGRLRQSRDVLENLLDSQRLEHRASSPQSSISATYISLGNTYLALANREKERQVTTNQQDRLPWQCVATNDLPETARHYYEKASDAYENALQQAPDTQHQLAAKLNQITALLEFGKSGSTVQNLWIESYQLITQKHLRNRFGVYAQIKLAKQGACLKQVADDEPFDWEPITKTLKQASALATELNDAIAISQALGNLGGLYEYFSWLDTRLPKAANNNPWYEAALTLTEQALVIAQPSDQPDIAYQWQWQLARLKKADGQTQAAIADYRKATKTLQSVRNNLLSINSEVQFSFRDNVEPVYRELADLLLQDDIPSQSALEEVISLIDNIQLAELESFLQCDLTGTVELTNADLPEKSAVIYTVILSNRLEVITQLPDQKVLQHHRVSVSQTDLESVLANLRAEMEKDFITPKGDKLAADVYSWLIQAQESALESSNIDTLVFVLDSHLRNIPIATLQDTQGKYLIEKYAIALTPRLQLKTPEPISPSELDVLFFGLTDIAKPFQQSFAPLPFVEQELQQIQTTLPNRVFLNDEFTSETLKETLSMAPSRIIHFATHGEFSSDPEETFILSWNEPIKSNDLNSILRRTPPDASIDILVLSACKTADGDNRATLGLAGLALQAGAQSTLASLWNINDAATAELIGEFYQALTDSKYPTSRAKALQNAQLKMLDKYKAPAFWAPFVLVGNWL